VGGNHNTRLLTSGQIARRPAIAVAPVDVGAMPNAQPHRIAGQPPATALIGVAMAPMQPGTRHFRRQNG